MSSPDLRLASGPNVELGKLLARLRDSRGMAQKEVAHLADIDGSTLSRLESGERGVSRDVLDRICRVLDLTRPEQLEVQVTAGLLTEEAARFLADAELSLLAEILTDPALPPDAEIVLRQYLTLALSHAAALGLASDKEPD